jgi:demethylmenaquinone methyltransferase/2-methoxy-6-polyprenyl-1,4-benzoquinol methylase
MRDRFLISILMDAENLLRHKKSAQIREMFNSIAHRYDLANHVLSAGIDRSWRKRARRELAAMFPGAPLRILDVCCGTGDLSLELAVLGKVVGLDFARHMLKRGQAKVSAFQNGRAVELLEGDSLALPFGSGTFDVVSAAFGVRNFENLHAGLREMARVLRGGGALAILEFSKPSLPGFALIFNLYFFKVLPALGGFLTGHTGPYRYLPASVQGFLDAAQMKKYLCEAGLSRVRAIRLTGGVATLYLGIRD